MEWSATGLVLGARPHGESALVLEVMTREHGRHLGLVHGGRSRRLQPVLQAGNAVVATWRARIDEQLGTFTVEPERSRAAALLGSAAALAGLAALAAHLRLLPERDPHPALFDAASVVADHLHEPDLAPALFIRFELLLLAELGFGLDLTACAATGDRGDLAYVSPRSGRAVGREAGAPWGDRLLPLPAFLSGETGLGPPDATSLGDGFRLAAFFLDAQVYEAGLGRRTPERDRFVALVLGRGADARPASATFSDQARISGDSPGDRRTTR